MNISEPNNRALVVSIVKTRNERERSTSLDWVMSIEVVANQNEQAGSSRKQGNNSEILEMLRIMEQGKLERDIQLSAQSKKRN